MRNPTDIDDTSWAHRLPPYLYVADLVRGKRVIELGCGDGEGARFVAGCGAASVTAVDHRADVVDAARARHRAAGLVFARRDADALGFDDHAFHCAFVPDAGALLRRRSAIAELRRVLAPAGHLVVCARSADHGGAREGGLRYHDFADLLGPAFGAPVMVAQAPFVAVSLVEYARAEGAAPDIELDTSLLARGGAEPVARYVAVFGPRRAARPLAIVQLPTAAGLRALGAGAEAGEAVTGGEEARAGGPARGPDDADAVAAGEGARAAAAPAVEVDEPEAADSDDARLSPQTPPHLSPQTPPQLPPHLPSVSEQIAGALEVHARHVEEMERALAAHRADADELRRELAEAEARLSREGERRAAVQARLAAREEELKDWRRRAAVAEGELMRARLRAGERQEPGAQAAQRVPAQPAMVQPAAGEPAAGDRADALSRREADLERRARELDDQTRDLERRARELDDQARDLERRAQDLEQRAQSADHALAESRQKQERATANWREAEAKKDEVWRRVGELQAELERMREESVARSARQAQDARKELARAREDGIQKLVASKEQLRQSEAAREQAERQLHEERDARRAAEAELARAREAAAGQAVPADAGRQLRGARDELREIARSVAAERDAVRAIEDGLAELVGMRRHGPPGTPAEGRAQELAFELGVKDAELMLLGSGVAALQSRLGTVRAQVERARADMAGRDPSQVQAAMDELAEAVSRTVGAD